MPGPSIKDLDFEAIRRRLILGEGAPTQQSADDRAWAAEHRLGYGSVDAPSPWGYNRDAFAAEHPNYAGGYYNPQTGGYDGPDEPPPWVGAEPQRVGASTPTGNPQPSLLSGGDTSTPADWGIASPESSGSMPGAAPQQDQGNQGSGEPTLGQLMEMLSTYTENAQTSNGT